MHPKQRRKEKKNLRLWKSQQLVKQKNKCYYCKCKLDITTYYPGEILPPDAMTIDHVLPRWRGGKNEKSNMVLACFSCNNEKGGKTLIELESDRVGLN